MTEVQVMVGGGGVGKTTVTSLLALSSAYKNEKVLAITFDPSLRLGDLLNDITLSPDTKLANNLEVFLINPIEIFEQVLQEIDYENTKGLKENKLFKNLLEQITGLQEFTSLYYLNRMIQSNNYDRIIVDTPPFQDALDFFKAPENLKNFFEAKVLRFFLPAVSESFLGSFLKTSRKLILNTLKNLTGSNFFSQLLDMLQALEKMQPVIMETLEASKKSFRSERVQINYISLYTKNHVKQARSFLQELKYLDLDVARYYLSKYPGDLKSILENSKTELDKNFLKYIKLKSDSVDEIEERLLVLQNKYKFKTLRLAHIEYSHEDMKEIGKSLDANTKTTTV